MVPSLGNDAGIAAPLHATVVSHGYSPASAWGILAAARCAFSGVHAENGHALEQRMAPPSVPRAGRTADLSFGVRHDR
jgi:hypothetical protein